MILKHPFFATLVLGTPTKEDPSCPTAYTDGKMIGYNPDFMESLPIEEVEGVLAHEALHIAFLHMLRIHQRNPILWNIAADFCINLILRETGFSLPKGALYDERFKGDTTEQVYDKVQQECKKGGGGKGRGGGKDPMEAWGNNPLGQDLRPIPGGGAAEEAAARREIEQRVAQAANLARMAGKMGGALERFVNDMLNPVVPWNVLLREYMTITAQDDESWTRRNRRFRQAILPARWSERMGEIVVIGDTSGSIGHQELQRVVTEISAIADQMKPERIRVIWADAQVAGEETFDVGETIVCHPKGGGGTDMRVPLRHAERYDPVVAVLITDGYTPWPDAEPPFPLIVLSTTDQVGPVGKTIRLTD